MAPGTPNTAGLASVRDLVEAFAANLPDYQRSDYLETPVRSDFIDPLLRALGWDVGNTERAPESLRDVTEERRFAVGDRQYAPDYSMRLGGERQFFVEAKKPSENIKNDPRWAFQLRRYGWNAKVPISVLTDFEELAIYDCRTEPVTGDLVATDRIHYFHFSEYVDKWDDISSLLSKESVQNGSLTRYRASPAPRGGAEVDDTFLDQVDDWRLQLAQDLNANNPGLSDRSLRYAVQLLIDRIVFLRMCEDRAIETHGHLQEIAEGENVYRSLMDLFRTADARFNSGLFHFRVEPGRHEPDTLTPSLHVSDACLERIVSSFYRRAYDFAVIPVEVLGSAYERFLGKTIVRAEHGSVSLELKPEYQKQNGAYYTPTSIVSYIVSQTLGALLEGKGLRTANRLRVIDPACGSGSFLVGAYRYLLDWFLQAYINDDPGRHSAGRHPRLVSGGDGSYRLSIAERKRILTQSIYGVDVDPQAVEIAKLSLSLVVLEGETGESMNAQLQLFQERALPDIDMNIRWGNSLVSSDFYDSRDPTLFDLESRLTMAAFDWDGEFSAPFDAVIGNPPYIDSEWMVRYREAEREYCSTRYKAASGNWDVFCAFIERGMTLLREGGVFGFIVPNKLGSAEYAAGAREVLTTDNRLLSIRDYSRVPVFPVAVYPIVVCAQRIDPPRRGGSVGYERVTHNDSGAWLIGEPQTIPYRPRFADPTDTWPVFGDAGSSELVEIMRKCGSQLSDLATVSGAATVGEAYEIKEHLKEGTPGSSVFTLVNSGLIDPYENLWGIRRCRYLGLSLESPVIECDDLRSVSANRVSQAQSPKIIVSGMTKRLECIADTDGTVLAGKSTTVIIPADGVQVEYILAVLNSDLVSQYYSAVFGGNRLSGGYLRIGPPQIRTLPVPHPDSCRTEADEVVQLVRRIHTIRDNANQCEVPAEKALLARDIDTLVSRIDVLAARIYAIDAP